MNDNIVTLLDREGKEVYFKHLTTEVIDDKEYDLLINKETNQVTITHISTDENGEEVIMVIGSEDGAVFERISNSLLTYNKEDGGFGYIYMIDKFEVDKKYYTVCVVEDNEGSTILEIVKDENGIAQLLPIVSDDTFNTVLNVYKSMYPGIFNDQPADK